MAPYSSFSTLHQARTDRDPIKLRKPVVEKMRRDRINGCIEQLKVLLEKELHREGCSKLEKADVLEMTVCFLKQQLGQVQRAPNKEVQGAPHTLPQTEAWLRGSTTSPQPRDTVTNSVPVWRPW
ncbi:hairy-related 12 [Periophthalmus magnuspinnatus]|uniref:hairy-related 12 n=1 Tax=Periophthalmus magnuspinnatus TaxID=409849 RepID=UPI00145B6CD6|nr:hairy-related 12 [Periophthalmus magnuspinnatus]